MTNATILTVLIPTFQRKRQLTDTLLALQSQSNQMFKVVVCDNNSDYDFDEIKSALSQEFANRVVFFRNSFNVGATANITGLFLKCETKYCWLLGDDDLPTDEAIDIIYESISKYPDTAVFHFPMMLLPAMETCDEIEFSQLADYVSFYEDMRKSGAGFHNIRGDLIFLSNKVYNLSICSQCMDYLFTYAHTRVSQILPIIRLLDTRKASVRYIKKEIVVYQPPRGDHWNIQNVVQGMANISFLPIESLTKKQYRELLRIIMLDSRYTRGAYIQIGKRNQNYLRKVYGLIYKDILSGKEKLLFQLFIAMSRSDLLFQWLMRLMRNRRKTK